jgi:microcystin-dependent protein
MSLPALPVSADTRSITERVNVLIRDYNTMLRVPAGCVMPFAGTTPPDGWLLCYGQAVSRTGYSDLFAAIGTTYGAGDGSTTFNLPDLRGRVAAGKDDMGGSAAGRLTSPVSGATLGASGGEQSHMLSTAEIPAHSHGVNDPGHAHSYGAGQTPSPFTPRGTNGDGTNFNNNPATNGAFTGISIQNAGGGGAHNNTQPTIVLNHIIST